MAVSFIGGGNRRTQKKPPTCQKSLTNFYHIMLYTFPWSIFESTSSVVIGTDCIGSCKSNYHTITATTAPLLYRILKKQVHSRDDSLQVLASVALIMKRKYKQWWSTILPISAKQTITSHLKKVLTVMVNNSTNINKTNNHLSPKDSLNCDGQQFY